MHDEGEETRWDIKKVVVGLLFLCFLLWVGYDNRSHILQYNNTPVKQVEGTQTKIAEEKKVPIPQIDLQEKVNEITQQISNLDMKEVASSSPQVQKVLKDMETLKDLPRSQAKQACMQICSGL